MLAGLLLVPPKPWIALKRLRPDAKLLMVVPSPSMASVTSPLTSAMDAVKGVAGSLYWQALSINLPTTCAGIAGRTGRLLNSAVSQRA